MTTVKSERTKILEKAYVESKGYENVNHFEKDLHHFALHTYKDLPQWACIAYATRDALIQQDVYITPLDRIIGRIYLNHIEQVEEVAPVLDCHSAPFERARKEYPYYDEMCALHFINPGSWKGHITWLWSRILKYGVSGMTQKVQALLEKAQDEKAEQCYRGVLIVLEAITIWNQKHVVKLYEMGMIEQAKRCERVPQYPATSFCDAVQAYNMQQIMVLSENPYGGNSPGRLDYYLWEYLKTDLEKGEIDLQTAREWVDELFLRFDETVYLKDGFGITLSIGGTNQKGESAVNPLTYIMIESVMDLNITHPLVYPRIPKNPPKEYLALCAKYMMEGDNRAQILGDEAIIKAMQNSGVTYEDAIDYACGGCMEIAPQGRSTDYLFNGWHNIPKMLELAITGGECLKTHEQVPFWQGGGLQNFDTFDAFYDYFIGEVKRYIHIFFHVQDDFGAEAAKARPAFLLSSMLMDCLEKGRVMHDGGGRYNNYGSTPIGLPNVADSLFAIKKAIYDDKICDVNTLLHALKTNFKEDEMLRLRLQKLPKYGQQNKEADEMANRLMTSVCNVYASVQTRFGGTALAMVLTFTFGPPAAKMLGASADGSYAGKMIAHGITPQSSSMTKGLTTAICSNLTMPMELFTGAASTMWDFDANWATQDMMEAIMKTFIQGGGHIFQGNTTDVEELLEAQKHPENAGHIIVRVGGYSARFTQLTEELQEDIIQRYRHSS